jgi:hypothetical protein
MLSPLLYWVPRFWVAHLYNGSPLRLSDNDINLLRKDLRSAQKQIISANVLLTDTEAQKFWPV